MGRAKQEHPDNPQTGKIAQDIPPEWPCEHRARILEAGHRTRGNELFQQLSTILPQMRRVGVTRRPLPLAVAEMPEHFEVERRVILKPQGAKL